MNLLAIDSSTEACSCALFIDGEIQHRNVMTPRRHAEFILPLADDLLAAAGITPLQLDGVAFGCGPGSFTGLRLACGIAQGIAFAADIPIAPVSSLATLAQAAYSDYGADHVLAAIDARMKEIYWGKYILDTQGIMRCEGEEQVCTPTNISLPTEGRWYGIGSGWTSYADQLITQLNHSVSVFLQEYQGNRYPQARAMIPLALAIFAEQQAVNAAEALPVYLRNQVVSV
jgi:tRNA threonylcarbamoyladenosine biosynthesis protein TsaB